MATDIALGYYCCLLSTQQIFGSEHDFSLRGDSNGY